MSDEKNLDNKPLEVVELSEDALDEASGGVMIYPSERMRARCADCGYTFYVLVPLGRKYYVGCTKCRSGNVVVSRI